MPAPPSHCSLQQATKPRLARALGQLLRLKIQKCVAFKKSFCSRIRPPKTWNGLQCTTQMWIYHDLSALPCPPLSFQIQREVLSQIWRVSNPGPGPKALKSRSNPRVSNSWMVCMRLAFLLSMAWQRLNETQLLVVINFCYYFTAIWWFLRDVSVYWRARVRFGSVDWQIGYPQEKRRRLNQFLSLVQVSSIKNLLENPEVIVCVFFMEIPSSCSVIVLNIFLHSVFNPPYSHQATIYVQSHRLKRTCTSWFDLH